MAKEISVILPLLIRHEWQVPMTRCCIDTMRCTTSIDYELIVVDSSGGPWASIEWPCDTLIKRPAAGNATADINAGLRAANCQYTLYMGNDVFVRDEWAEALLECFDIADCGIATLGSADLMQTPLATLFAQGRIMEGFYGPFMMFDRGRLFDEVNFPSAFADSNMLMQVYAEGARSYRNCRVIIQHLNRQTINGPGHEADFNAARERFAALHANSPLLVGRMINEGWIF